MVRSKFANWECYEMLDPLDECCLVCGAALPDSPKPGSVHEQGYCSIRCKRWDEVNYKDNSER